MNICYTLSESCCSDSPETTRILSEKRLYLPSPADIFHEMSQGDTACHCPEDILRICALRLPRREGTMKDHQMHDLLRVHVRALARLQQIHEAISTGHCPEFAVSRYQLGTMLVSA
jgi:hypothetical protein